jgi:hypothetical protein
MNKVIESHLSVMLEGYEGSLKGVNEYIDQAEEQLNTARGQRGEINEKITELRDLLGLSNEDESQEEVDGLAPVVAGPGSTHNED